ncbi:MAG: glycosyltransferase family 4 protein [Acidobacteria bacterium]|nr:glycosyltransferase family 4 protein [Acidobacteriota bacterium]
MSAVNALHQFLPTLERSAVGDHVLEIQSVLRDLGLQSEVFAENVRPNMARKGRPYHDYGRSVKAKPDDVLLYHVAQGASLADWVRNRPETLVVDHHNITPAKFFSAWEPHRVPGILWGRRQLAGLAERAVLGMADSAFNASELVEVGFTDTAVVPILLDLDTFDREVDAAAEARLTTDATVWLFVGRVVPNKAQADLVKAFALYRAAYDPAAQLRIVGSSDSVSYTAAVREFIAKLGLDDAVEITGGVSDGELAAHYRTADVYVCVSDHEGFNVPVLEAWHHGVPVVGYSCTAVTETLGDGGLLLPRKDAATVAAAVWKAMSDRGLHDSLVAAGHRRLATYALPVTRQRLLDALARFL